MASILEEILKLNLDYRWIFYDIICLHLTMKCDPLTQQDKMFWILEEQDNTKLSSDFESDISNNTYLALLWKFKILKCLYEVIKRFAAQPSSKFWTS